MISRRDALRLLSGLAAPLPPLTGATTAAEVTRPHVAAKKPRIAALVTEYRENSHADLIVGKFLDGCKVLDTEFQPKVEVVSLYCDQVPSNDTGQEIAARHGVRLCGAIAEAL